MVLVASEQVLLLRADLPPIASAAKRLAAVPFAIEERIAEPLDAVHVALGREMAPNSYLVAVVRHEVMRKWVRRLEEAELGFAALVPDALSLPQPEPGSWTVDLARGRALVRSPDGTGFAVPEPMLEQAWQAAGEPECASYGEPLPPAMHGAGVSLEPEPLALRLAEPALDLRQGLYAPPRPPVDPLLKRLALVVAGGALAHAAIYAADTALLQSIAEDREAEVRLLAQSTQPGFAIGSDLGATASSIAPRPVVSPPSLFVPLLLQVGTALGSLDPPVEWRSVGFDEAAQSLTVAVEGPTLLSVREAGEALREAGAERAPRPGPTPPECGRWSISRSARNDPSRVHRSLRSRRARPLLGADRRMVDGAQLSRAGSAGGARGDRAGRPGPARPRAARRRAGRGAGGAAKRRPARSEAAER